MADEAKKKKLNSFKIDLGKIKQRAERFNSSVFWNPKAGTNKIRILPPWSEEGVFFKEVTFHYGFTIDGQNRAFPCLRSLGEAKCPACQVVGRYVDEKDPEIKKLVQQMRPKPKWFMNVIDRKADSGEVKIFGATFTVAKPILSYFTDTEEDYGDITDPDEGRDIIVEREGMGFTTEYSVRPGAKPTPIGLEGWQSKLHDLDTEVIREILTGKEMLKLLEDTHGDTLDLTGITADPKKSSKKATDETEESEDDDEDEGGAKAVKRSPKVPVKTGSGKKAKDDDDVGLDDDDED